MRDCSTCTTQNRECVFGDDWESCLTCQESEKGRCDGLLDLSQIVLSNIDIRTVENEIVELRAQLKQDSQLLTSLTGEVKAKQTTLAVSMSSGAESASLNRLRSEIQQLTSTEKSGFERYKKDKLAHDQLRERLKELHDHEENLFLELLSQVQRRTVNDCSGCQNTGKVCTFLDESEQCTECQRPPRQCCQGSVDDDDTDRIEAALEVVDSQIDEVLSRKLSEPKFYLSLKERLKHEEDATMPNRGRSGLSSSELEDSRRLSLQVVKTRKELEELRNRSLIDDTTYQELRIRRRILNECHSELLQRGVFYYDELEELAGYPERRGYKRAEDMDDDEFREAVEWAIEHPGEWQESLSLVDTQSDQDMDLGNASDSGIEL